MAFKSFAKKKKNGPRHQHQGSSRFNNEIPHHRSNESVQLQTRRHVSRTPCPSSPPKLYSLSRFGIHCHSTISSISFREIKRDLFLATTQRWADYVYLASEKSHFRFLPSKPNWSFKIPLLYLGGNPRRSLQF